MKITILVSALFVSGLLFQSTAFSDDGSTQIALPPLPYAQNALEPAISEKTMGFHYGKHHEAYVDKLNMLLKESPLKGKNLEEIIQASAGKEDMSGLFNNAAQAWNHTFFWRSMKPEGGGEPKGKLLDLINKSFGSYADFRKQFAAAGLAQFGSGWVWLVQDGGTLKILKTSNADTPIAHNLNPLLTCDVWEHAYYLDYQNRRADFLNTYLDKLVNWRSEERRVRERV